MGSLFTAIMMLLCILHPRSKKTLIISGICMLVTVMFYYFTDTRTVFVVILCTLGLYNVAGWINRKWMNRLITGLFGVSFVIEVMLSVLASCHVNNILMSMIDKVISGRFHQLGNTNFTKDYAVCYVENWHLLSTYNNQAGCDLGYAFTFYYYGIIAAIIFIGVIVYTAVTIYRRKEYYKFAILTGLCTYTFMEIYFFSNFISKNFLLIFCAGIIWENRQGEIVDEQEKSNVIHHHSCI